MPYYYTKLLKFKKTDFISIKFKENIKDWFKTTTIFIVDLLFIF